MEARPGLLKRSADYALAWFATVLAGAGALAVGAGAFDRPADLPWYGLLLGAAVLAAGTLDAARRIRGELAGDLPTIAAGPMLWTVSAWMVFRMSGPLASHAILIPAGLTAWLLVSSPPRVFLFCLACALTMETGLTLTGSQSPAHMILNLLFYAGTASALCLYARTRTYRRHLRAALARAKTRADTRESARHLGLDPVRHRLPGLQGAPPESDAARNTVETVTAAFDLHLEIIRRALQLNTAALLWSDPEGERLHLKSVATVRRDIHPGPYPLGAGIAGALLRTGDEITMAPVRKDFAGLPYYRKTGDVGSLAALRIPTEDPGKDGDPPGGLVGILCVDRIAEQPWEKEERALLRLSARKLSMEVAMARQLQSMACERGIAQQLYLALRDLNGVLGLEPTFDATLRAVKSLVSTDFIAISLIDGERHRVVRAEDSTGPSVQGQVFHRDQGLVGQVLKMNCTLPAGGEYHGPAPIFSTEHRMPGFQSILVVPLRKEKGDPIGALAVAAREAGVFAGSRRDILELLAAQAAIKIDLAQAHEQISRMAVTDGLTGLANHRTFQRGLDVMLHRARRRSSALCLILCDIDLFKHINDACGHPFGDRVLRATAAVLAQAVRKVDLAARYGGEEFAIVLEDSDEQGGRITAERVRRQVEALVFRHEGKEVKTSMSLGLAAFPADGEEKSALVARADQALYHAKKHGRNRTVAWSDIVPEKPTVH